MELDQRRRLGITMCLAACAALIACGARGTTTANTGGDDASSRALRAAPAAADETSGRDDRGEDVDASATLEARIQRGLAIAPVPLDTDAMTGHQRRLVGLGSYLVNAAGDCTGCHSPSPSQYLAGGVPFFLDHAGHVVWTRNLTPDPSTGLKLTLAQFKESLRTGRDFHAGSTAMLVVMPWLYFRWQSDADLEAIYAYLRAIPAVVNGVPADHKDGLSLPPAIPFPGAYTDGDVTRRLPGEDRAFDWRRGLAISPREIPSSVRGETARQYGVGSLVANATIGCNECHTHPDRAGAPPRVNTAAWLTGGTVFTTPPPLQPVTGYVRSTSANLEGAQFGFFSEPDSTYARFHDLIHTGTLADETPARPLAFPMFVIAHSLRNLLDQDLGALYAYLDQTSRTAGATDGPHQPPARYCATDAACGAGETCNLATNECVGGSCGADADCGTCQTCDSGTCHAPAPTSACLLTAQ